eukprot:SAG11_NODE_12921_length_679_cov_0.798276_1_plen_136_part_10
MLSKAFFEKLPSGFVSCPGCSIPIEVLAETSISTAGISVQELPRGATLDVADAERHKAQCRFRCIQCCVEFCSGCSIQPYHYGYDCKSFRSHRAAKLCRFCGDRATSDDCCEDSECRRYLSFACKDKLSCGHLSCG